MGTIKIPTNFNIELEFEVPEFYRRLLALIFDFIIEFFYFRIAIEIYISIIRSSNILDEDTQYNLWSVKLLLFLPIMIYHVVLEITMNGQSIGKRIMGLRVVDEFGGKASISQFLIRWLLRISDLWIVILVLLLLSSPNLANMESLVVFLFGMGFLITDIILVISSKKGQRIGDILAHTILIRTHSKSSIEETVFQEVSDNYIPSYPAIMQLSDKDINAIKSILQTARKKGDFQMAENAAEKIKNHLKIDSDISPFDFLEILLKDYNYLSIK